MMGARGPAPTPVPAWLDLDRLVATTPDDRWWTRAACAGEDPTLFFAKRGDTSKADSARAVCARCPVVYDCLADQLRAARGRPGDIGVFGRTTPDERRAIRRQLAQRRQDTAA